METTNNILDNTAPLTVAIIGSGKVGKAFCRALSDQKNCESVLLTARDTTSWVAWFNDNAPADPKNPTLVLITVNDDSIEAILDQFIASVKDSSSYLFVHCSGFLSSDIFSKRGHKGCSLHPAASITENSSLKNLLFVAEGDATVLAVVRTVMNIIGSQYCEIEKGSKPMYHLAATIATNFPAVLFNESFDMFCHAGIDRELAQALVKQLASSAMRNIGEVEFNQLITGPASRGDSSVIGAHVSLLEKSKKNLVLECYEKLTSLIRVKLGI